MKPHWRYRAERAIFRTLVRIIIRRRRVHIEGLDNVPTSGPVIVVGNHIATVDPPMVAAQLPRLDVFSMAKAEAFRTATARFFLRGWNAFPVRRQTADRKALSTSLQLLADGHALVIFPEGTRSRDTSLHRAFPGVGFIAMRSGAPVVCVGVWGTENVMPKGSLRPRGAPVHVRFGEPHVIPRRHADGRRLTNQDAADLVMSRLSELLPPRYRGIYEPPVRAEGERAEASTGDTGRSGSAASPPASAA